MPRRPSAVSTSGRKSSARFLNFVSLSWNCWLYSSIVALSFMNARARIPRSSAVKSDMMVLMSLAMYRFNAFTLATLSRLAPRLPMFHSARHPTANVRANAAPKLINSFFPIVIDPIEPFSFD